jgi:hypothetical protein
VWGRRRELPLLVTLPQHLGGATCEACHLATALGSCSAASRGAVQLVADSAAGALSRSVQLRVCLQCAACPAPGANFACTDGRLQGEVVEDVCSGRVLASREHVPVTSY